MWQEATTTTVEEKEHAEPKEKEEGEVAKEDANQGKEEETPTAEAAGELPESTAPVSAA